MEDRTFSTNNHPANGISDTFREFIEALVEEVVINGEPFEAQKKWLRKRSEAEGLNYETLESNLSDLFEALKELEEHGSRVVERSVMYSAKDCYLSEDIVNKLIGNAAKFRKQKAEDRIAAEREVALIAAQKEAERKAQEEQGAENDILDVDKEGNVFCINKSFQGKLSIPSTLKGTKVCGIKATAFYDCNALKSIVIPNTVTEIGWQAFTGCTGLTRIVIPDSVEYIDSYAFKGCTGLTSIVVSGGNKVYDSRDNCNAIINTKYNSLTAGCKNTMIPDSVTEICSGAFSGCTGLTSIVIPDSVTYIGAYAFSGCTGLTSIVIPNSVTEINQSPFAGCTGLTRIVVSEENEVFDSRDNCNAIIKTATDELIAGCKNTMIPDSVTEIGYGSFRGCTGLTSIVIPDSVTAIHGGAFEGCTGLTSIVIPDSVTKIRSCTFRDCTGLTSIFIPDSVTAIGDNTLVVGDGVFSGCTGLASIVIPASVEWIGNYAFQDCKSLTSIVIPNSVTEIGESAFAGCIGLTHIIISDSLKNIGAYAFQGCKSLTSIVIPNSVKKIPKACFRGCNSLKSAKLPHRFDGRVVFSKQTKVEYY